MKLQASKFLLSAFFVFAITAQASVPCPTGALVPPPEQRLPANFSPADKQALIDRFVNDGRPILIVTDATSKQRSGVVTVMKVLQDEVQKLTGKKIEVVYVTPEQFPGVDLPYQDLRAAVMLPSELNKILRKVNPQAVHIMVEFPMGTQAQLYLKHRGIPFTTAYHTEFPEYVAGEFAKRPGLSLLAGFARKVANAYLRYFHSTGQGVMVPTETMAQKLVKAGYDPEIIRYWSHGVDTQRFVPEAADPKLYEGLQRPITFFAGRIAVEKNLEDFLDMNVPGTKVLVGDGPELARLKEKYKGKNVVFLGRRNYEELPKYYASADAFAFPSLTDTFGLVQLEANAAGLPVVAYKVQGPIDVVTSDKSGKLADYTTNREQNIRNLEAAWREAIKIKREDARKFAEAHTWEASTVEFLYFLKQLPKPGQRPVRDVSATAPPETLPRTGSTGP